MSIDKIFSRELRRVERVPQRALYRQTRKMIVGAERKMLGKGSSPKSIKKKKFAKEIIWFFAGLILAFLLGFIIFYLIGEFLPDLFVELVTDLGSIALLYFIISIISFIGIYLARIIVWSVKMLTLK